MTRLTISLLAWCVICWDILGTAYFSYSKIDFKQFNLYQTYSNTDFKLFNLCQIFEYTRTLHVNQNVILMSTTNVKSVFIMNVFICLFDIYGGTCRIQHVLCRTSAVG